MSDQEKKKGKKDLNEYSAGEDLSYHFNKGQQVLLGLQHTLAMFGACILVPILTGLSISVTLFSVGVGTLIFHYFTKGKIPGFLGSSFAFILPLQLAAERMDLQYAQGGIIGAGIVYLIVGYLVHIMGPEKVSRVFPAVVTGPIIMVIGLGLAPVGIGMSSEHWPVALITLGTAIVINIWGRGLIKVLPIVIGLAVGYVASLAFGIVDFSTVQDEARILAMPGFTMPKFSVAAILLVTPAAIVSVLEHFGDILAIGSTIGKDVKKDPGLPSTFYGGGVGTIISGFLGGPSLTTYGENIGVLALTRIYATFVVSMGAVWAIGLAFIPKVEAIILTIPVAVIGGISVLLYGMIAGIGVRTVVENRVNFVKSRNLIVASVILVLGVGGASFNVFGVEMSGMVVAALSGVALNLILPE
ncbi:uracil-xanthine permease [Alkaliphilus metalliredigens QYMF]|uniref:Uracil-xanthine permease n=1 Tax=Alkaliphilus metalliredigens (strain QYMF) TaxID=293826 RepID=A6TL41_ALKMQ|nr:solute carrier family 23 protein [Alkaliphilus metalliredigens]ABR46909.1 uracil-xanthine permease [Alkaliphilus metalliredigens QYMF]